MSNQRVYEMPNYSKEMLAKRSRLFRYVHYVVTSVRLVPYAQWTRDGEPNPFVSPTYRHQVTQRADFHDIFDDFRSRASRNPV